MLKKIKELVPKLSKIREQEKLEISISDVQCPICLEILIEPVTMPCKHEICLKCFDTMLDQTNLCCPMCRMRISTWSRTARLSNTLINSERWKLIQKKFPNEIKNRLEGKTQETLVDSLASVMPAFKKQKCSEQGEIRQEYLDFIKREEERLRIEKEQEENLSRAYIEQVIREEESLQLNEYLNREQQITSQNQNQNTSSNIINQTLQQEQQQQEEIQIASINTPVIPSSTIKKSRSIRRTIWTPNEEFTRVTRARSLRLGTKPVQFAANNTIIKNNTNNNNQTLDVILSPNSTANTSSSLEIPNSLPTQKKQKKPFRMRFA